MGCMPFLYGQRCSSGLYQGKRQPLDSYSGAIECFLREHSRCSMGSEWFM